MRQIARDVGVQAGALYNYTPDKQSLLFDLMQTHMGDLLAARAELPMEPDPVAALKAFARLHLRFHAERPDEVFIAYMELRNLSDDNFTKIEEMRRAYEDQLEAILRAGIEQGVFRVADSKIATMAAIAMLTGVNTWFRQGGRLSLSEVEQIYWEMLRQAVGAQSE